MEEELEAALREPEGVTSAKALWVWLDILAISSGFSGSLLLALAIGPTPSAEPHLEINHRSTVLLLNAGFLKWGLWLLVGGFLFQLPKILKNVWALVKKEENG